MLHNLHISLPKIISFEILSNPLKQSLLLWGGGGESLQIWDTVFSGVTVCPAAQYSFGL